MLVTFSILYISMYFIAQEAMNDTIQFIGNENLAVLLEMCSVSTNGERPSLANLKLTICCNALS